MRLNRSNAPCLNSPITISGKKRLQLLPACEWLGILNKPGFAGAATLGPGQVVAEIGTHPLGQLGQALGHPG